MVSSHIIININFDIYQLHLPLVLVQEPEADNILWHNVLQANYDDVL